MFGRRDRLPEAVRMAITRAEWETREGDRLHLRIAVDYAGRDAIRMAAANVAEREDQIKELERELDMRSRFGEGLDRHFKRLTTI